MAEDRKDTPAELAGYPMSIGELPLIPTNTFFRQYGGPSGLWGEPGFANSKDWRFDPQEVERKRQEMLDKQADLMPFILSRLRELAPAEARAIAGEAAASSPLDAVALSILADWLEEHQYDGLAREVRRLPIEGGQLVILRASFEATEEGIRVMEAKLKEKHPDTRFLIVGTGWDVIQCRWDRAKE